MITKQKSSVYSILSGFFIPFVIYHAPAIFQKTYSKPLIWLLEAGMGFFVLIAYFIIKLQKGSGMKSYGLFRQKAFWINLLVGMLFGICFFSLNILFSVFLGWNSISISISFSQALMYAFVFSAGTVLPSLTKDTLTRLTFLHTDLDTKIKNG